MADEPLRATLPLTIPSLVAAIAGAVASRVAWLRTAPSLEPIDGLDRPLVWQRLAVLSGVLMVVFWFAGGAERGGVWYLFRIAHYSLAMAPILIGRFVVGSTGTFWWCCALLNVVVSLSAGGRLPAFLPIVLWAIGRIWRRGGLVSTGQLARYTTVGVFLLLLSGAVGITRDTVGRFGVDHLNFEAVAAISDGIVTALFAESGSEEFTRAGIGRMITEANQAVFLLTPHVVPYKSFDGFMGEFVRTARVSHLTGGTRGDFLEEGLGTAPANEFGFMVNESTSVEFPMLADGWSRAGVSGAILMVSLCIVWGVLGEGLGRRVFQKRPVVGLAIVMIVAKFAMDLGGVSLPAALKTTLYYGTVFVVTIAILSRGTPLATASQRESRVARRRPDASAVGIPPIVR